MFERRIKILLGILAGFTLMLIMRAGWLQIVQGADYDHKAVEAARRPSYLETFRGRILDFKGRVVAEDAPCIDAAVDYRAIDPDAKESQEWLAVQARKRLVDRGVLKGDRKDRTRLIDGEIERVKADLQFMWQQMARLSNQKLDEIEQVKESIKRRVRMRQRYATYKKFEAAKARHDNEKHEPSTAWYKWLVDDNQTTPAPQIDSFNVLVAEQTETHAILHAIDNDTYVALDKLRERCPGLELKKGIRRNYPFQDVACHVIGQLSPVLREDLEKDRNADETKKYFYNDYMGRSGIERLAEPILRGARGIQIRQSGNDAVRESIAAKPGEDVTITLDMDLQQRVQEAFMRYEETGDKNNPGHDLRVQQMKIHEMHGAAVVIDVATGQVRAMVSYPTYDLNQFDSIYTQLLRDVKNQPLLNRATQSALEPGSTVKPMVGLSAITAGLARPDDTIECTGYLVIDGRIHREGRCWVASKFGKVLGAGVAHHPIPWDAPHPTGFLTFADALERSCNVFFETMADRLKMDGLNHWMHEFGLGKITGIGISEREGRVPGDVVVPNWRSATWFSGIGQTQVLATPLQMANVAATIARRGVWVRPHLLASESPDVERRDLHLNPQALDEAVEGMINVVTGPAGTGKIRVPAGLQVAGKTGTAQAARFTILKLDDKGKPYKTEENRWARDYFEPSTPEAPNADMPWYRGSGNTGTDLGHAWFIGFAPAHNPTLAFAVLVEYGGAGGKDAGPVATAILEACVEHGYLSTK